MNAKPVSNPDAFRKEIKKYIFSKVQDNKIANNVEKSIFNFSIKKAIEMKVVRKWDNESFVIIYMNKFKMIFHNLKNDIIVEKLKQNVIKPHEVSFLTHVELLP